MTATPLPAPASHRRRRAAAVAVLGVALGVALGSIMILPSHRPAYPHGAAYAAIAGRPATADVPASSAPLRALRLAGFRHAIEPKERGFPRAAIDYTPGGDAAAASAPPIPLHLAALDGAPAAGAYFPAGTGAIAGRSGFGGGGALPGGGFAGGGSGIGGGGGGGATTPPAGVTDPESPGTAPGTGTTPPDPTGSTPATVPAPETTTPPVNPPAGTPVPVVTTTGSAGVPSHADVPTATAPVIGAGDTVPDALPITSPPHPSPANGMGGVPEPATWALLILGFGAVGASLRRRQRRRAVA